MTDGPNAMQADYWSGPSGMSWIDREQEMDVTFSEITALILETAGLAPGEGVVDIGCGTGALSLAAAEAVGEGGHVLATDISAPLLARAAARAAGYDQVETLLADAEVADWRGAVFDAAISRFGVMFFANPPAAFANIARALKPGGRIVFAAWGPLAENPWWTIPQRIASARLGSPPTTPPNVPGPFGLSDADWALEQLRAGGLREVGCALTDIRLAFPGDSEAIAASAARLGPAMRIISQFEATDADKAAIAAAVAAEMKQFDRDGRAFVPARLHLFTARA